MEVGTHDAINNLDSVDDQLDSPQQLTELKRLISLGGVRSPGWLISRYQQHSPRQQYVAYIERSH